MRALGLLAPFPPTHSFNPPRENVWCMVAETGDGTNLDELECS